MRTDSKEMAKDMKKSYVYNRIWNKYIKKNVSEKGINVYFISHHFSFRIRNELEALDYAE